MPAFPFKHLLATTLLTMYTGVVSAQQPSGTDIWVGKYSPQGLSDVKAVTNRKGYDNQPWFIAGTQALLFTRMHERDGQQQTDIYRANFISGDIVRVTDTLESEYSPTIMPDGEHFSVIRVDVQGKQTLWSYTLQGKPVGQLLNDVEPVGYHTWVNADTAVLFVLGEPHTLQLANTARQQSVVVDKDIGPSLFSIPSESGISYTRAIRQENDDPRWEVRRFDPSTRATSALTVLPSGAYYYTWTPSGKLLAASGTRIFSWSEESGTWQTFADVSAFCIKTASRIKVSSDEQYIALVCDRQ